MDKFQLKRFEKKLLEVKNYEIVNKNEKTKVSYLNTGSRWPSLYHSTSTALSWDARGAVLQGKEATPPSAACSEAPPTAGESNALL